jgi:hypothetical protein
VRSSRFYSLVKKVPEAKISVIKSPIVPIPDFGEETTIYSDQLIYYVHLANGIIATKPEDFPSNDQRRMQKENDIKSENADEI